MLSAAQRWRRVLNPELQKGAWTAEEVRSGSEVSVVAGCLASRLQEAALLALVREHGTAWSKVAAGLGNRSDIQCRYRYLLCTEAAGVRSNLDSSWPRPVDPFLPPA